MPNIDLGKVVGEQGPEGPAAQGTMMEATYDPNGKSQDVFAYADAAKQEAKDYAAPKTHASQHASGGSDQINPAAIGAADLTHAAQHSASGSDPVTPAAIGAVSKTGDTMTGNLGIVKASFPTISLNDTTNSSYGSFQNSNHVTEIGSKASNASGADYRSIRISDNLSVSDLKSALQFVDRADGTVTKYDILHNGNVSDLGIAKVATGSYTGTGVGGVNNPNSITFPFVPKVVMICGDGTQLLFGTDYGAYPVFGVLWDQLSSEYKSIANNRYGGMSVKATDKTLSWYSNETDSHAVAYQLNTSGTVYRYVAFG